MKVGLTPSEKFVNALCEKSFLKLWTHPNPKGKKGKELCDCLIVCAEHVIIISVKEIQYKDTGDHFGYERWTKKAIEDSAGQIWGAERWLQSQETIERHDGRIIILPEQSDRKYHRISVSLGSECQIPITWGDLGFGFVHVCDENSTKILFEELDTITDFTNFLQYSEKLMNKSRLVLFDGGGMQDLIALYLQNSLDFHMEDNSPDMLVISDDLWTGFSISNEYKYMKLDFKSSYIWDRLIEYYTKDLLTDGMFDMYNKDITKNEQALITMALQPRGHRANLADSFMEFLQKPELKIASRAVTGHDDTAFVFLIGSSADREYRAKELLLRCLVIRQKFPNMTTVVGIATDRPNASEIGYSSDIAYLYLPELTLEDEKMINRMQNELGYFQNL